MTGVPSSASVPRRDVVVGRYMAVDVCNVLRIRSAALSHTCMGSSGEASGPLHYQAWCTMRDSRHAHLSAMLSTHPGTVSRRGWAMPPYAYAHSMPQHAWCRDEGYMGRASCSIMNSMHGEGNTAQH